MIHLTPAFGRDYKSKAEVLAAFNAGQDFIISDFGHPSDGRPINRPQIQKDGHRQVQIRFKRLTAVAMLSVS